MAPATLLAQADPHLAALKSFALSLMRDQDNYDMGDKLDMARSKLYQSIRDGDRVTAKNWLNAVELAVEGAVAAIPDCERSALEAVAGLKRLLEVPRRLHS